MSEQNVISGYCTINNNQVTLNGNIIISKESDIQFNDFAKQVYKEKLTKYSKFFKMDSLSKLAFLTSDILIQNSDFIARYDSNKTAVVIGNTSATLDTDKHYFDTIKDRENYFPSPAHFVYTLPNIMIGEICIKHKIRGENLCLITSPKDLEPVFNYVNLLLDSYKCDACIAGYVDLLDEQYHATLVLIEKKSRLTTKKYYLQNQFNQLLNKQ